MASLTFAVWPAENPIQHHVAVVCVPLNQALFDNVGGLLVVGKHQNAVLAGTRLLDYFSVVLSPMQENVLDNLVSVFIFTEFQHMFHDFVLYVGA